MGTERNGDLAMTIELLNPEGLPKPDMYRQVATGTRLAFITGQVARDPDGAPVGGANLVDQVEQALRNVVTAVQAAAVPSLM